MATKNLIISKKMKWLPENKECKSLVIYGSNISSTVNFVHFNRIVRKMVQIPSNLNSLLIGLILSDGFLVKKESNNVLFVFKQSLKRFEFMWTVFFKLSHFCQSYPKIEFSKLNGKVHPTLILSTRVYPCFVSWYNLFYFNNKKIVPLDLYTMLDYETFAYWIMGDGTKSGNAIVLQTQSFTVKECVFIISILIYKFDLNCSLIMQRNQPTIYIKAKSVQQIKKDLIPYFPISMRYKLNV
jgi:hypothetical protein